jgi:hypothetical protein
VPVAPGPAANISLPADPPAGPAKAAKEAGNDDSLPALAAQPAPDKQRLPTIEESVARRTAPAEKCAEASSLKRINKITNDVSPQEGEFPPECGLGNAQYQPRRWAATTFAWTAPGLCHRPLYFEDEQLERYGHSAGPLLQPLISPARFFLTFPVLPYAMGLYPPNEHIYTLGYYRPGDRAPYMIDAIPLSVRAGLFEAGAWTGAVFALP